MDHSHLTAGSPVLTELSQSKEVFPQWQVTSLLK
jgi:hypothetical protein